jgi:hypothetical protein
LRSQASRSRSLRGDDRVGLAVVGMEGDTVRFELSDVAPAPLHTAWVALTQGGLSSQVTAGENRGRLLKHEHVVRALAGPLAAERAASPLAGAVALPAGVPDRRFRLTAWTQDGDGQVRAATWLECTAS